MFADDDGRSLLGTGAVRTKHSGVLVAFAEGDEPVLEEGNWEPAGQLKDGNEQRAVFRLRGRATFGTGEYQVSVATAQAVESSRRYWLHGQLWTGTGIDPIQTFLGMPEVRWVDSGGVVGHATVTELRWSPDARRVGFGTANRAVLGEGTALFESGEHRFRERIRVLPSDLEIRPAGTADPNVGTLWIQGTSVAAIGVDPGPNHEATISPEAQGFAVSLRRTNTDVTTVCLTLRFETTMGRSEARVSVPFPTQGCGFARRYGAILPSGQRTVLERLSELVAVAWSPNERDVFELSAGVGALGHPGGAEVITRAELASLPLGQLLPVGNGRHELSLDTVAEDLEALLGLTPDIDGAIELRVVRCSEIEPIQARTLVVCHYERFLRTPPRSERVADPTGFTLRLDQTGAPRQYQLGELRVEARPILEPNAEPVLLQETQGGFRFDTANCGPGGWLVMAFCGETLVCRPLFVPVLGEVPEQTGARAAACETDKGERTHRLDEELTLLAEDPFHPDWDWVDEYLQTMPTVPVPTFDVVRAVARNRQAAVVALLRSHPKTRKYIWEGLESLPFLWAMVPVDVWMRGLVLIREGWDARPESWGDADFQSWIEEFATFARSCGKLQTAQLELACILCDVDLRENICKENYGNGQFLTRLRDAMDADVRELCGRHEGRHWPRFDLKPYLDFPLRDHAMDSAILPTAEEPALQDNFRYFVIHAPLLAAGICAHLAPSIDHAPDVVRSALRRARAFDKDWFDTASSAWLARLVLAAEHAGNRKLGAERWNSLGRHGESAELAGDIQAARRCFEEALAVMRFLERTYPASAAYAEDLWTSLTRVGRVARAAGDIDDARGYFDEALAFVRHLVSSNPDREDLAENLRESLVRAGEVAETARDIDVARGYFDEALALARHLVASNPDREDLARNLWESLVRAGEVAETAGDIDVARGYFDEALARIRHLAESSPRRRDVAIGLHLTLYARGENARRAGDCEGARRYAEEARGLSREFLEVDFGHADPMNGQPTALGRRGRSARCTEDDEGARRYFEVAQSIFQKLSSTEFQSQAFARDRWVTLYRLGDVAETVGNRVAARGYFEGALSVVRPLSTAEPGREDFARDVWVTLYRLGNLEASVGEHGAARHHFTDALALVQRLSEAEPGREDFARDVWVMLHRLGNLEATAGNQMEALLHFGEAVEVRRRLCDQNPHCSDLVTALFVTLCRMGELARIMGHQELARKCTGEARELGRRFVEEEQG